jgi:hypothetical protein
MRVWIITANTTAYRLVDVSEVPVSSNLQSGKPREMEERVSSHTTRGRWRTAQLRPCCTEQRAVLTCQGVGTAR